MGKMLNLFAATGNKKYAKCETVSTKDGRTKN